MAGEAIGLMPACQEPGPYLYRSPGWFPTPNGCQLQRHPLQGGGRGIARAEDSVWRQPFAHQPHTCHFNISCGPACLSPMGESVCFAPGWYHSSCCIPTTAFATGRGTPGDDTSSEHQTPGTITGPYFLSQKPQRHPRQPLRIWREASTISVALTSSRREKRMTFQATTPAGSRQMLQV